METTMEIKSSFFARGWENTNAMVSKIKDKTIRIMKIVKKIAMDDPRRVVHSLKMALALTLVSLFYYVRPLYDGFGVTGMWAVLTVVVVFEFSVGATISKGINRGFATLMAGALGVGAQHLALLFGKQGEPIVLGSLVFLLAATSTFTRFIPDIKRRYDYGVLIFILTFSLVAVSGYRVDKIINLASQRWSTILVGVASCMTVSIIVCPVWAGEDLHGLIANNIGNLATFLEGFGEEYFKVDEKLDDEISSNINSKMGAKLLFHQSHKSVLSSKTTEETLANFARWEPCHGRFKLHHPWSQYLKIGALTRQCAYQMETLGGYIDARAKIPMEFRINIKDSCTKMCLESSKALRVLASSIQTMNLPKSGENHVKSSKEAARELKNIFSTMSLYPGDDLLGLVPDATVASILLNISNSVENIYEAVGELARLAHFKQSEPTTSPDTKGGHVALLHRGIVNPVLNDAEPGDHEVGLVAIKICDQKTQMHAICIEGEIGLARFVNVNNISIPTTIPA